MGGRGGFGDDLRASLRAWQQSPALVVLTLALTAAPLAISSIGLGSGWSAVITLAVIVATVGFNGTQRVWYLRVFAGDRFELREVLPFTGAFWTRFFVLGLYMAITSVVLMTAVSAVADFGLATFVACLSVAFVLDVVLTFVTPALAFSTRSVGEAIGIGVGTLRESWSDVHWYALAPGIVGVVIPLLRSAVDLDDLTVLVIVAVSTLLALAFKGAAARWYLRENPEIGRDGAAFDNFALLDREPWSPFSPDHEAFDPETAVFDDDAWRRDDDRW